MAKELNELVWSLLGQDGRTADDDERMVHAAHASAYHWREAGGPLERPRAEWLVSHVYTVIGRAEPALVHAQRSLAVCQAEGFGDFDLAYAYEAMARANAAAGNRDEAQRWRDQATKAAAAIADGEDRELFEGDLAAGPWYDLTV